MHIFPNRLRWLAISTGLFTIGLIFVGLFNFPTFILIAGGVIERRYFRLGKWLVWLGAAGLSLILFPVALLFLQGPSSDDRNALIVKSIVFTSTVLIIWCDLELIMDALARIKIRWQRTKN